MPRGEPFKHAVVIRAHHDRIPDYGTVPNLAAHANDGVFHRRVFDITTLGDEYSFKEQPTTREHGKKRGWVKIGLSGS